MSSFAVMRLIADSTGREAEVVADVATWAADWPNVKYGHYPNHDAPGENFLQELALEVAKTHMSWFAAALMPQLVVAKDLMAAPEHLKAFIRAVVPSVDVTSNEQLLPGLLLGIFEAYCRFEDYSFVQRELLDVAVALAAVEVLTSGRLEASHIRSWIDRDHHGGNKYQKRLRGAVSAWARPYPSGESSISRGGVHYLIRSLRSEAYRHKVLKDPFSVVVRQVCTSAFEAMPATSMMDMLLK